MNRYLSGDMKIPQNSLNLIESVPNMMKKFKCSFCEKICKTAAGLKIHTTKKHLDEETEKENTLGNKRAKKKYLKLLMF